MKKLIILLLTIAVLGCDNKPEEKRITIRESELIKVRTEYITVKALDGDEFQYPRYRVLYIHPDLVESIEDYLINRREDEQ